MRGRFCCGAHARLVERIEAELAAAALPPSAGTDVLWALESAAGHQLPLHELAETRVCRAPTSPVWRTGSRKPALIEPPQSRRIDAGAYCIITAAGGRCASACWPTYQAAVERYFGAPPLGQGGDPAWRSAGAHRARRARGEERTAAAGRDPAAPA